MLTKGSTQVFPGVTSIMVCFGFLQVCIGSLMDSSRFLGVTHFSTVEALFLLFSALENSQQYKCFPPRTFSLKDFDKTGEGGGGG